MCGRFTLQASPQELRECFALDETPGFAASYNIAPSQPVAAVRVTARQREMALLRWGLVPAWANEPGSGYRMINARAETVAEKPAYRSAFRRRRCLIPVTRYVNSPLHNDARCIAPAGTRDTAMAPGLEAHS